MPNLLRAVALVLVVASGLAGCSKPRTEQEQLDAFRGKFAYKNYRRLSALAVPVAVKGSREGAKAAAAHAAPEDSRTAQLAAAVQAVEETQVHLGLAVACLASGKLTPALAEADLAESLATDGSPERTIALTLRAVVLYQRGWKELAQAEAERLPPDAGGGSGKEQLVVGEFAITALCVQQKNWTGARTHGTALGELSGYPWIGAFIAAVADIQSGELGRGLATIKKLQTDPSVPAGAREVLGEQIAAIEREFGAVDQPMFVTRAVAKVAWAELRARAEGGRKSLWDSVEKLAAGDDAPEAGIPATTDPAPAGATHEKSN